MLQHVPTSCCHNRLCRVREGTTESNRRRSVAVGPCRLDHAAPAPPERVGRSGGPTPKLSSTPCARRSVGRPDRVGNAAGRNRGSVGRRRLDTFQLRTAIQALLHPLTCVTCSPSTRASHAALTQPRRPHFPALSTRIPISCPVALTWPVHTFQVRAGDSWGARRPSLA